MLMDHTNINSEHWKTELGFPRWTVDETDVGVIIYSEVI